MTNIINILNSDKQMNNCIHRKKIIFIDLLYSFFGGHGIFVLAFDMFLSSDMVFSKGQRLRIIPLRRSKSDCVSTACNKLNSISTSLDLVHRGHRLGIISI